MANVLYDKGREGILNNTIVMTSDIRVVLLKSTYVPNLATDEFLSHLAAHENGRSAALANKTYTAGVFDADDTTLNAVSADACNALALFRHSGSDATARLIAYIDTPTSGLPFTPGVGQAVPITWDNGANKIFKL